MSAEAGMVKKVVEGALYAAGEPLNLDRILMLFDEGDRPSRDELKTIMQELSLETENRGVELKEVASGWRFQVREESGPWVSRLWAEKAPRYSRAMLETIALIAYRQPVTRGEIEEVRGVSVSSNIIKVFLEREWIRVVGHRDVPGKPAMFATTRQFLDYFNLKSLNELPLLPDIKDLEAMTPELALDESGGEDNETDGEADSESTDETLSSNFGGEEREDDDEDDLDFSEVETILASVEETLHPKTEEAEEQEGAQDSEELEKPEDPDSKLH